MKRYDKLELLLRVARHQKSPTSFVEGIDKHTSEFHDRLPHLEGEDLLWNSKTYID